jgi:hypothetical protein
VYGPQLPVPQSAYVPSHTLGIKQPGGAPVGSPVSQTSCPAANAAVICGLWAITAMRLQVRQMLLGTLTVNWPEGARQLFPQPPLAIEKATHNANVRTPGDHMSAV